MPETALTDRNDENELCECQLFPLVGGRSLISIFVAFSLLIFHRKGFFFFPFALARGRESRNGEPREASSAIWSPSLFCSSCRRLPFPEKAETRPAVGTAPVLRGRRQREKSRHDMTTTTTSVLQSKATERKQLSSKARQEKGKRSGAAVTKISPASP